MLNERQRAIQMDLNQRYVGETLEVMVEGKNEARGQWIGRTSQHKILNFTAPPAATLAAGRYCWVRVTGSYPNSLLGTLGG